MVSGRIPEELVDDVQNRSDIVEVITDYVRLEHKGRNYIGLCPFHQEKTPSFTVTSERQMFYCFGCSTGGNVFRFIMLKENLSFPESVRYLAERVGVHIPDTDSRADERLDPTFEINALARDFYRRALAEEDSGRTARMYLEQRGIPLDVQDQFQIGYAPSGWEALSGFMRRKGLTDVELVRAGIAVKSERGGVYDRFRNRIIFPVWDVRGRVVGFGGRVLDDSLPKYLNSPETPVFQKGKYLYGLHLAKQGIREEGRVVIVEGYLDVIAAHQYGVCNVVAALGTSLTRDQGRLLMRHTMDVLVAFDADPAGIKATIRSLDILQDLGCRVGVVSVPEGQDPDQFLREQGLDGWKHLVDIATPLLEYKLHHVLAEMPSDAPQHRLNIVQQIVPNIRAMNSEVDREISILKVSAILGLNPQTVKAEIGRFGAGGPEKWPNSDKIAKKLHNIVTNKPHARQQAELGLLRMVIENPEYLEAVRPELGERFFVNNGYQHILDAFQCRVSNGDCKPAFLANDLNDDDQHLLGAVMAGELPEGDREVLLKDYMRTIKLSDKRQQKRDLLADLDAAERAGDLKRATELMIVINNLMKTP